MSGDNSKFNFSDKRKFKPMVGWFDVTVLLDAAKRTVISSIFGEYADKRVIHSTLVDLENIKNKSQDENQTLEIDVRAKINKEQSDGIWIDYVADLGDGFDSTYAIANLIGRKELTFDERDSLPRADVLIMGGDQVYPTPTREDYKRRLEKPYDYAFPDSEPSPMHEDEKHHPLLFMIPGNHDWYDGLTLFLAKFCRGSKSGDSFANWRMFQDRSYFATRLSEDWWIWGMDTQLDEDVDMPQAAYFEAIAKEMPPNSKIILCASVPTWLKADYEEQKHRDAFGKGINYFAENIICRSCNPAALPKIYAVISGDQHHYSRYVDEHHSINFITAGGGGAFLHPTHHLKDDISNIYWQGALMPLKLDSLNGADNDSQEACFPSREKSRSMAKDILRFPLINKQFTCTVGAIYVLMTWIITWTLAPAQNGFFDVLCKVVKNPLTLITFILFSLLLRVYADYSQKPNWAENFWKKNLVKFAPSDKTLAGILHSTAHFLLLIFSIAIYSNLIPSLTFESNYWFLFFLGLIGLVSGFLGGFIWGAYLYISSYYFARHYNDSFSSMRSPDYKNFLRMHIKGDELTIYPIGVEKAPQREDWVENPDYEKYNPEHPEIITKSSKPINYKLIEEPITLK